MAISTQRRVRKAAAKTRPGQDRLALVNRWVGLIPGLGKSIKPAEILFFTSQLSLMLEIGTPLTNALTAFRDQTENQAFKEVVQAMLQDIEEGQQLSEAMKKHPRVFNSEFVSMIKAGEAGGFLKKVIDRIIEMQERNRDTRAQLKSALIYPAFLCVIGFAVIVFVIVGVLPRFTVFFEGKEDILPATTRFLMALSSSMRSYWWGYVLTFGGLVIGLKVSKDSRTGQALLDRFFVSGPMVAGLFNKIYTCEMLRTLGHLMESQVPLLEALEMTRNTVKNRYFRDFIDLIMEHVQEGGKFSQPFATYPYILESVKQMVATGEETGNLPKVMLRLAEYYDKEVDQEIKNLSVMIEPVALVVLGAVIGLIVSSVILPMFKLAHAVH